jgi:hypothetical protein
MSDLLMNEGSFYQPEVPEERQETEQAEKSFLREALPVMEELLEWFDKQSDECDRLSVLDMESKVPVESQIIAYRELANLLRAKKGELSALQFSYRRKAE